MCISSRVSAVVVAVEDMEEEADLEGMAGMGMGITRMPKEHMRAPMRGL